MYKKLDLVCEFVTLIIVGQQCSYTTYNQTRNQWLGSSDWLEATTKRIEKNNYLIEKRHKVPI